MKIYTKKGDKGETRLFSNDTVFKDHARIEAYGTVDELNSWIGVVSTFNPLGEETIEKFKDIQKRLFDIGAILSAGEQKKGKVPEISAGQVKGLEDLIDELSEDLEPLDKFILPGGHRAISFVHIMRTVCRRAERRVVTLHQTEPVPETVLQYLNRLSDLLFVTSRYIAKKAKVDEDFWIPGE